MAEIYERLPGEPTAAFTAFQKYRDMEADASYAKVARMLGKSKSLIGRWARQWRWLEPRAPGQTLNILSGNSFRVSTRRTLLAIPVPRTLAEYAWSMAFTLAMNSSRFFHL